MRQSLTALMLLGVFLFMESCSGQSQHSTDARTLANRIQEKTNAPGISPGADIFMKATIDGEPWTASKLIPDKEPGNSEYRVTGTGNNTTIGFYVYIPHIKVGDVFKFNANHAADFITKDVNTFYGGSQGTFVVTALDDRGFEGTFNFTATTTGDSKTYKVTAGSLRFPWAKRN